jgi:hypothetical protein
MYVCLHPYIPFENLLSHLSIHSRSYSIASLE